MTTHKGTKTLTSELSGVAVNTTGFGSTRSSQSMVRDSR